MPNPLISKETYTQLLEFRRSIVASFRSIEPAYPMISVGPTPGNCTTDLRLLFIGQATRGFNEPTLTDYNTAVARAREIVRHETGPFWYDVRNITTRLLKACGNPTDNESVASTIGWTNLVKIGAAEGNPPYSAICAQASIAVDILDREIALVEPRAVFLLVRNFAQAQILERVFGSTGWHQHEFEPSGDNGAKGDFVATKVLAERLVVWMNHPRQPGPRGYRAGARDLAVKLGIEAITQGRSGPV